MTTERTETNWFCLQSGEIEATAECGCWLDYEEQTGSARITYCPTHEAAAETLKALKRMAGEFDAGGLPMTSLPGYARNAIKKAEGTS